MSFAGADPGNLYHVHEPDRYLSLEFLSQREIARLDDSPYLAGEVFADTGKVLELRLRVTRDFGDWRREVVYDPRCVAVCSDPEEARAAYLEEVRYLIKYSRDLDVCDGHAVYFRAAAAVPLRT